MQYTSTLRPYPWIFVPTADDNSVDEAAAGVLSSEFNIDFASCVGALIILALSRVDIIHAVNKMAKFTRRPGRNHFIALVHILRYLRDHVYLGVSFYSDLERSPIHLMLKNSESVSELAKELFFTFSDSSWNDDIDTRQSTGCYLISYMGGIVDHSSNMPDPVAMSSAEAEYNEACLVGWRQLTWLCYWMSLREINSLDGRLHCFLTARVRSRWAVAFGTQSIRAISFAAIIMFAKGLIQVDLVCFGSRLMRS